MDCIEPEWMDQCSDCGNTFMNQGSQGDIECPLCAWDRDDDEDEE